MQQLIQMLQGRKSYILAIFMALFAVLKGFNVINTSAEQDALIYGLVAALFGISLSAKVARLGKNKK